MWFVDQKSPDLIIAGGVDVVSGLGPFSFPGPYLLSSVSRYKRFSNFLEKLEI
ncbi:hypothetical protein J5X98_20695 [Leptothermofonsia sichuanensis E412]|uniref:hypothetical protein n=1 Tax=Leptothermofonsia sichuanensis TaxID=2917832 RepID=UPI001CA6D30A|nr:hypothetical protein [Leptothermofonsia sichuanensis]QZZ19719.1 hypothetical protein J5X98_20695 [Leptothermofonsia sichuanensis E412]